MRNILNIISGTFAWIMDQTKLNTQFGNEDNETAHATNPLNAPVLTDKISTLFYQNNLNDQIASRYTLLTSLDDKKQITRLLNISSSHIHHMISKTDFIDAAGRTMHCSAFQYALWAENTDMLNIILNALDKADARAIPKIRWDAISEKDKQFKPYVGTITKEEISAIRTELFEQYKEVVDKGLNYTITRYEQTLDITLGKYQPTNPRIVIVRGETHFDIIGPEFCLPPKDKQFSHEKGKIYVSIKDNELHYELIALSNEKINGIIRLVDIECLLKQLDNPDQLKPYIPAILKITAEKNHTHPQAFCRAFQTYVYGLNNNWSDAQLLQQSDALLMAMKDIPQHAKNYINHDDAQNIIIPSTRAYRLPLPLYVKMMNQVSKDLDSRISKYNNNNIVINGLRGKLDPANQEDNQTIDEEGMSCSIC